MKKTFSLLLFIFCSLFLCAEKFEYNEIFYNTINDSTAEVHFQTWWGFSGYQHDTIVIPPTVDYNGRTYRVVGIVQSAFFDFTSLITVSIPNTVTTIGISAFANCTNLSKVLIPSSVQTIGSAAFAYCTSLKEVTCLAPIPPTCGDLVLGEYEIFYGVNVANIPLYVPTESIELYKNADHWKDFGQILPIEPTSYKSQWCDTWNVFVENGSVYPPHEETYRYQLAQDIVIGDYTYTAVVSKAINDALDAPHYVAAVRFTDDRKVYIYYDNAEYLLYDFNVQEGEELEVFAGINNYTSEIKTYKCTVTGVEQYAYVGCPATITLEVHNHPDDFREFYRLTQWIEGVGDINGFLNGINHYVEMDGGGSEYLLCAYKGDELKYTGDLYEEYGCGDDAEQSPEDLFPTLWGLQRTVCYEYCGETEEDNSANFTDKQTFDSIFFENDKPYILCNDYLLREEDNKIFLYSQSLNKDIVLYDFTLEVGDSLPTYIKDFDGTMYSDDTLVVTGISSITLLDGKKYKKWTFNNGMEYVEAIGMYGGRRNGNFFGLIQEDVVPCHIGTHLVCVSKNGKLLYQMDDAELERLNTECLCDGYQSSYKDQWCDQWNVLSHGYLGPDEPLYNAHTIIHSLKGDTIINDLVYQKLVGHLAISPPTPNVYIGALRFAEDKKVFVYYDNNEYLLYDFNVQIGDTLNIFGGIEYYIDNKTLPHIVVNIDTLDDGRIKIISDAILQEEINGIIHEEKRQKIWIEGIGSLDGIVYNTATTMYGSGKKVLLCAYHNNDCCYTTDYTSYASLGCVYNDSFFTATEEVNSYAPSAQKIISNGQLLILRDGKTYNVMGMEVK